MTLTSTTTLLAFLYTIPFCMIALHALGRYRDDRQSKEKKHVFYMFLCFSASFVSSLAASILVAPGMSPERQEVAIVLFKLFDFINIIGVFWLFVFLTDFMENFRKYVPLVAVHTVITLIVIVIMPFDVKITWGAEYVRERAAATSAAILVFLIFYWGIIAYQFWEDSKLVTKKMAVLRTRLMSAGGVFTIMAYLCAVLSSVFSSSILVYIASVCAVFSGIVFYAGFVTPEWLRRMLEK